MRRARLRLTHFLPNQRPDGEANHYHPDQASGASAAYVASRCSGAVRGSAAVIQREVDEHEEEAVRGTRMRLSILREAEADHQADSLTKAGQPWEDSPQEGRRRKTRARRTARGKDGLIKGTHCRRFFCMPLRSIESRSSIPQPAPTGSEEPCPSKSNSLSSPAAADNTRRHSHGSGTAALSTYNGASGARGRRSDDSCSARRLSLHQLSCHSTPHNDWLTSRESVSVFAPPSVAPH